MTPAWKRFTESGATSIEYALIAALVSVAIFAGADRLGNSVQSFFQSAGETVEEAASE